MSKSEVINKFTAFTAEVQALASRLNHPLDLEGQEQRIPAGEWRVLQTLVSHGPSTVPQIARARSTSRQNIQVLVNRLRDSGYVAQQSNPAHKRSVLIELTEAGRALVSSVGQSQTRAALQLEQVVSAQDLQSTMELLRRLRLAMENGGRPKPVPAARPQIPKAPAPARPEASRPPPIAKPPPNLMPESVELPIALL